MNRFQHLIIFALVVALIVAAHASSFAQQANPANQTSTGKTQDRMQNPAPQSPPATQSNQGVVRINTQLVQVDAVVTDKKGRHVEDLTQADFELLVDGKKYPITHFSHIALPAVKRDPSAKTRPDSTLAPESMPTRQIAQDEVRRTIAFIVDDLGLSPSSTELVRESLKKFISEQMQEGDLVAIIRTGAGLGMLEQFTSDKRILYTAVEKLIWNPLSRDMMPSFSEASSDEETDDVTADQQAALDNFEEFRETSYTSGTLGAIRFVVSGLRPLPGRKTVILLSDGFRINSRTNNDNTTEQVLQSLRQLVEQANRSSVVIYSIDAKGLQPFLPGANFGGVPKTSSHSDAMQSAQEALEGPSFMAQQTGGFTIVNTNDLNIGIEEALYDQQSYYLLGFDPDDEKFDRRYHSIKLNVTRPGLKVRTRSGFFGVDEGNRSDQPQTRGKQILSALLSPLGVRDLSLRMTPYFFNSSKGGPLVRALFHIDCSKLTFTAGQNGQKVLNLDLAAFAFDEEGAPVDLAARRLTLNFDENQYRQALANGLAYRADFQIKKPGAYQFRAVLRDGETGLTGSAGQFIRVPDLNKNRLALSGLVLTTPKAVATSASTTVENNPSKDAAAAVAVNPSPIRTEKEAERSSQPGDLQTTPYIRRFPRTGWIQYGAAIYNATPDKKTGRPQITVQAEIYRDGKAIYQFPARALELSSGANPKRFDYIGRLRLNNFPEGEYLLRLIVTDGLAKKKFSRAEQWMDFSIKSTTSP